MCCQGTLYPVFLGSNRMHSDSRYRNNQEYWSELVTLNLRM
jgi:hypothetical protein